MRSTRLPPPPPPLLLAHSLLPRLLAHSLLLLLSRCVLLLLLVRCRLLLLLSRCLLLLFLLLFRCLLLLFLLLVASSSLPRSLAPSLPRSLASLPPHFFPFPVGFSPSLLPLPAPATAPSPPRRPPLPPPSASDPLVPPHSPKPRCHDFRLVGVGERKSRRAELQAKETRAAASKREKFRSSLLCAALFACRCGTLHRTCAALHTSEQDIA